MNVLDVLLERVADDPDRPAIVDRYAGNDRRTTFRQLDEMSAQAAGFLHRKGIGRGDRVVVLQPMSLELYEVLLGLLRVGAVAVVPDLSAARSALEAAMRRWPCKGFIGARRAHLLRFASRGLRSIPVKISVGGAVPGASTWRPGGAAPLPIADLRPDELAAITFTSGTTGQPKAVARSHGFLLAQDAAIRRAVGALPPGRDLTTLPMFVLANLARGSTSLLPSVDVRHPGHVDGAALANQMREQGATTLMASPALVERVVTSGAPAPPTLRDIYTGGGPVFPLLVAQCKAWAPHARFHGVYGSSEAEPMAELQGDALGPKELERTATGGGLLAGPPVEGLRLALLDPDEALPPAMTKAEFAGHLVPSGAAGEIVVTGDHVLKGYLGGVGDQETKVVADGEVWHRTGDGGRLDEDGRLWLLGRLNGRIGQRDATTWPLAVEAAARMVPGIRQAALVEVGGRRVLAVEGDPKQVQERLGWAGLDEVRPMRRIPVDRRHNSKVDLAALRRRLS